MIRLVGFIRPGEYLDKQNGQVICVQLLIKGEWTLNTSQY